MEKTTMYHIEYEKPKVTLLQQSGLGVAEIAARTCYDSFENSENECVKNAMEELKKRKYEDRICWRNSQTIYKFKINTAVNDCFYGDRYLQLLSNTKGRRTAN